ncbi:MAG: hypothetical protein Q8K58_11220 [Acidimicrobiales bacterium]|nr:hypothetical protein [Acidimicrobiales bacterium]
MPDAATSSAISPTFSQRKAAREAWREAHPPDPFAGLVTGGVDEAPRLNNQGDVIGVRRTISYYEKNKPVLRCVVHLPEHDDGQLRAEWIQAAAKAPVTRPRISGLLRNALRARRAD